MINVNMYVRTYVSTEFAKLEKKKSWYESYVRMYLSILVSTAFIETEFLTKILQPHSSTHKLLHISTNICTPVHVHRYVHVRY